MSNQLTEGGFLIHADAGLLHWEDGGVVRVGRSRVSLDVVVEQYQNGMSPEDMVRAYDTLEQADAHATIAYYLRHRDEVQHYLDVRAAEAKEIETNLLRDRPRITRETLIARQNAAEADHAQVVL